MLLLNLFTRNNFINLYKIHADLHSYNWKIVQNSNQQYKLVIYDFGFCIDTSYYSRNILYDFNKAIETNNYKLLISSIYQFLQYPYQQDKFLRDSNMFIESNNNNINITNYIEFCISKNYIFTSDILELLLSYFLVNNYFQTYITNQNIENDFKKDIQLCHFDYIKKLESTNNHITSLSAILN